MMRISRREWNSLTNTLWSVSRKISICTTFAFSYRNSKASSFALLLYSVCFSCTTFTCHSISKLEIEVRSVDLHCYVPYFAKHGLAYFRKQRLSNACVIILVPYEISVICQKMYRDHYTDTLHWKDRLKRLKSTNFTRITQSIDDRHQDPILAEH